MLYSLVGVWRRRLSLSSIAIAAALIAGCGSSNSVKRSSTTGTASTPRKVMASLGKPLLASCVRTKPAVTRFNQDVGKNQQAEGWRVIYNLQPAVTNMNQTALIVLLENPPVLPAGFVKGGHFISVAGRRVSLFVRPAPAYGFVARWKTSAAVYVALANGRQAPVLEHVIGCLP